MRVFRMLGGEGWVDAKRRRCDTIVQKYRYRQNARFKKCQSTTSVVPKDAQKILPPQASSEALDLVSS
jgi:hypothetical protein